MKGASGWRAAPIALSNRYPCKAVTVTGNYHNPGMAQCGAAGQFYGVFAAGAHGLRVTDNDCLGCAHPDHPGGPHLCSAVRSASVATGSTAFAGSGLLLCRLGRGLRRTPTRRCEGPWSRSASMRATLKSQLHRCCRALIGIPTSILLTSQRRATMIPRSPHRHPRHQLALLALGGATRPRASMRGCLSTT